MIHTQLKIATACMAVGLLVSGAGAADEEIICPVLDVPLRLSCESSVGYVWQAEVNDPRGDDTGTIDLSLGGSLLYWENDLGTDLTLGAHWKALMLEGYSKSSVGYALNRGYLTLRWRQRCLGGFGMILETSPGIYSALDGFESDDLAFPCGVTFIKALSPEFALLAGAGIYPGFDLAADPLLGFRWRPSEYFMLDFGYPETRLEAGPYDGSRFVLGAGMRRWPEYGMGDDPRERLMLDEGRAYAGLEIVIGSVQVSLIGGYALAREIEFKTGGFPVEIEDAPYVQIGLSGLN